MGHFWVKGKRETKKWEEEAIKISENPGGLTEKQSIYQLGVLLTSFSHTFKNDPSKVWTLFLGASVTIARDLKMNQIADRIEELKEQIRGAEKITPALKVDVLKNFYAIDATIRGYLMPK